MKNELAKNILMASTALQVKCRFNIRSSAAYMMAGLSAGLMVNAPLHAQQNQPAAPSAQSQQDIIRSITVVGIQRLEPTTVKTYVKLREGEAWSQVAADTALKDLYATELFADASIRNNDGAVVIEIRENPIINRIIVEGNKRVKDDDLQPEIRLAPRQIYSRSKVRADVARITELYKRKGRFAAAVEPKLVQLEQNRVDVVFEINEGPKSKVRQINVIGNTVFSDNDIRGELITKQARFKRFLSSNTTYDPDRLAFDQQQLRRFYLQEGYADFRIVSAVAELTPDKQDFIITFVVEEGERYKFGDIQVDSKIRDFSSDLLKNNLRTRQGDWYNAQTVEDTVKSLTEGAGLFGYAFAEVNPRFMPNRETKIMDITFDVAETRRVYVERIDINGNTLTQDRVVRREFRLNEGDAFNSFNLARSTNRIRSLGFFQEGFEIEQEQGSDDDRIILSANVEENPTGELSLSAGFSSIENFIFQGSVRQRNFRGKGQQLRASVQLSTFTNSIEAGFTEPFLFDRSISLSADVFRRDLNSFNFFNNQRNTTFEQLTTGFQLSTGVPVNEFLFFQLRYGLNVDDVTLDQAQFFSDIDGDGDLECDPLRAGVFLCDNIGKRTTSSLGYSLLYDTRNNRQRPTSGHSITLSQDVAGLGGSVAFVKTRLQGDKYWRVGRSNFIFSVKAEGGYIRALEDRSAVGPGTDDVRLTDRFFLGEGQIRGFDIRGVGPRVLRTFFNAGVDDAGNPINAPIINRDNVQDDAIGGRAFYLARAELEIPLGAGASGLGIRPSLFADVGAVFGVTQPILQSLNLTDQFTGAPLFRTVDALGNVITSENQLNADGTQGVQALQFVETFVGDSPRPRVSVGIGVNWNSPFGPFRIDLARVLTSVEGDDIKSFSFNVGTQF